ncbi:MAG: PD-(D/E)XK nuclease family protein [Clostridium sp.]|nr:PD-(D/E)XK nuclease family protein [Clostridium sp.]
MSIQFILGASGTGKTTYIYEQMINATRREGHAPVIFMLPEQANMAAEKDMVTIHPKGGTMDISILSFTRLAFKVFDELNVHTNDILDDYGKSMLIMKLLKEHEKELSYYGSMLGKQGFVDEVKSVLSEFYQYQVTEELLMQVIGNLSTQKSLYHKLSDLRLLLHAFNEAMRGSYMVTEQILSLLKEVAHDSQILSRAEIYFDGYTGFTPVQYGVVEELMKLGCNLYFSFTMDENLFGENDYHEQGLFALGKQSVDRLCKLAQDNNVTVLPHIGLRKNHRMEGAEGLLHLERQLFRFPVRAFDRHCEELQIFAAKNAGEEASFIARTIQEYVMKQGYRYSDFAVITGDMQQESEIWKQAMEMQKVPYFLDYSEPMSHNPIVEMITLLADIFRLDFSYESVFALLKTGFFDLEPEQIYELENFVIKYGIRGKKWWETTLKGGVKGFHGINAARRKVMDILQPVIPVLCEKKAYAREYITALYNFMSTNKIPEKLYAKSLLLEEEGKLREARAYAQVYDKFISVLDKTMDILGGDEIERDAFTEMLLAGVHDMNLGMIPSTLDQVTVGDMERTRLHHIKILFVAGMNEGVLPKGRSNTGILVDKDRQQLKDMQISLAPDSKEDMFLQQFYLYLQVTQPSEKLFLLFREEDSSFGAMHPSYFVDRIKSIFPHNCVEKTSCRKADMLPVTGDALISDFAVSLSGESMEDAGILQVMKEKYPKEFQRILQGYFYENQESVLARELARKLYGEHMIHSVSRLEAYAGCAYQFFLRYGLKLQKREEYSVESNNIGTILHAVMEKFFTWLKDSHIDPETLPKEERDARVEEFTKEAAKEENETIFDSSFRRRHQLEVFIRIAKRSIENLCRHLSVGNMNPAFFEEKFSPDQKLSYIDMALSEGVRMEMSGIVDRVDLKETEDAVYVKVIDYKSGAKDIDYLKMYEGRQLQLTVYMNVMLELLQRQYPEKKIIPTGMYYYHIHDPIIEAGNEEQLEKGRIEENRLAGLVNEDEISRELMDGLTGLVTPVRYKKDGSLDSRNASLVTEEELMAISRFVRGKMIDIGNDIVAGRISMDPEKGELSSPCNLCDYQSICRFEPGLGGNAYKIAPQMSKAEAKEKILQNETGHAGEKPFEKASDHTYKTGQEEGEES